MHTAIDLVVRGGTFHDQGDVDVMREHNLSRVLLGVNNVSGGCLDRLRRLTGLLSSGRSGTSSGLTEISRGHFLSLVVKSSSLTLLLLNNGMDWTVITKPDVRSLIAISGHSLGLALSLGVNPKPLRIGAVVVTVLRTTVTLPALHSLSAEVIAQVIQMLSEPGALTTVDRGFQFINGGTDGPTNILPPA